MPMLLPLWDTYTQQFEDNFISAPNGVNCTCQAGTFRSTLLHHFRSNLLSNLISSNQISKCHIKSTILISNLNILTSNLIFLYLISYPYQISYFHIKFWILISNLNILISNLIFFYQISYPHQVLQCHIKSWILISNLNIIISNLIASYQVLDSHIRSSSPYVKSFILISNLHIITSNFIAVQAVVFAGYYPLPLTIGKS